MELELAQKILKRFEINDTVISINQNKTGLINQTFELFTHENKYILQRINTQVFPNYQQGLENIILIKKWLKQTSYPYEFPSPLQNQYLNFDKLAITKLFNYLLRLITDEQFCLCSEKFAFCLQKANFV